MSDAWKRSKAVDMAAAKVQTAIMAYRYEDGVRYPSKELDEMCQVVADAEFIRDIERRVLKHLADPAFSDTSQPLVKQYIERWTDFYYPETQENR